MTFRDVSQYSNEGRQGKATAYLAPDIRTRFAAFEDHYRIPSLLHSDPPAHRRLRALIRDTFTPRAVAALEPRIRAITADLIDQAEPAGGMDAVSDFAAVDLPATVISEIFGVLAADGARFVAWSDDILAFQGVNKPAPEILEKAHDTLLLLRAHLGEMILDRRRAPRDDLLGTLVAAEEAGDRLSQEELINTSVTLLAAGHETTRSLIGNGPFLLLSDRIHWQQLLAESALVKPAIEEILRYESPVPRQPRLMKTGAVLSGERIRKGEMVYQMLNAANRDPAHFAEPETFDLRRQANRHLAFGNGIHFCLGAPLAGLEGQIAFSTLLNASRGFSCSARNRTGIPASATRACCAHCRSCSDQPAPSVAMRGVDMRPKLTMRDLLESNGQRKLTMTNAADTAVHAFEAFVADVRTGEFPGPGHLASAGDDVVRAFVAAIDSPSPDRHTP
ncbi:MAG: cytochrome P450 [Chloroflexi bacterium]|nr:cytochrome P450 [Chloroflexota bacterium]